MTYDFLATQYYVRSNWPARREEPDALAIRLCHYLDTLAKIDETLGPWSIGRKRRVPYRAVRNNLASLIDGDVMLSEDGQLEREVGFSIGGLSEDKRQLYSIGGCVGGVVRWPQWNRFGFKTIGGRPPDPAIVTYRLMKAATLATIGSWKPTFCLTGNTDLVPTREDGWFFKAWMTYVPPADAADIDLVDVPFSERTPDGGLLLSATEDAFDAGNPDHVEGARLISRATRHLNAKLPAL